MKKIIFIMCIISILFVEQKCYGGYKDYADVVSKLNSLDIAGGSFAKAYDIGTTINGTKIRGIVISKNATTGNNASKPDILLTGTIHAREWIAAEVCLAIATRLIIKRNDNTSVFPAFKDMNIKKLLENAEIVIVPVLNPDGYKYSRNEQNPGGSPEDPDPNWPGRKYRDWRKNRRDVSTIPASKFTEAGQPGDVGVDCNRNFPFKWNPPRGASKDPTNYLVYRGPTSGSEKETQTEMSLVNSRDILAVIDYHSYGEYVIYPWGHTRGAIPGANKFLRPQTKTKDKDLFPILAKKIADEISGYTARRASTLYLTLISGISTDWIYNQKHCAAFIIELGSDTDGFQPPETRIGPISQQNIRGASWLMFWAVDQRLKRKPKSGMP